ncbi:MAG TPA: condensation domain-containing protein, partial [Longimicrobiaceae bacterium]
MTTVQLLAELGRRGVRVWAEGEALRFSAPRGALTEELRGQVAARRAEVLALLRDGAGESRSAGARVERARRDGELPLSFAQRRLWFLDRLEPGSTLYSLPFQVRLRGELDAGALARSLAEVVRRHEVLRTVYRAGADGEPAQLPLPPGGWRMGAADLGALDPPGARAAAAELARAHAAAPFDLARGPVFRALLARVGAREHLLALNVHHVASDEWSEGVLFRELGSLYAAFRRGAPAGLDELPVQYADYALWQREQLRGEALERELAYWRRALEGAPRVLELPADRPRPAAQSHRGAAVARRLERPLLDALLPLARREGATLHVLLLAALQALLARYAGQDDVVVGTPIAGRTRAETEPLIGFFVNTLALRTELSGAPSFRELLRRVREAALGAYAHAELPFERLVEELAPERSLGHHPLFQVVLVLQDGTGPGLRLDGLEVEPLEAESRTAKFDLTLTAAEDAAGLRLALEYATDLFDPGTAERMLEHLGVLLEGAARDPELPLPDLPLLGPAERRRLLEEWSRSGDADAPDARCVHELFAEQAERTPDALALVAGAETLTYAELHRRSDALARRLAARGVGPDARVGICVERGPGLVVGLLAILKAGGAYLPLDPQGPADRLAFMLADASARLLLTEDALRQRFADFAGEVVALDGTPLPPAPSPARGEGENDQVGAGAV